MYPLVVGVTVIHISISHKQKTRHTPWFSSCGYLRSRISVSAVKCYQHSLWGGIEKNTYIHTHFHTHNICMQLFFLISSRSYALSVTVRWSTEEVATQQIALIMNSQCFPSNSARPMWAWGPHWWDYLCRQLPRVHSASVREKSIEKHQDDAGPGGSEPGQGTETLNLYFYILFWCGSQVKQFGWS